MEKLTEWDELQEAFNKVNLDEEVFSFRNGKLINESESYMKMKAILNCPEMQKSHAYLYNLDPEQLDEDEIENISKLYDLGCRRGFIKPDDAEDCEPKEEVPGEVPELKPSVAPACNAPSMFKAKIPCWTILYSAVDKNGDIKTGECFSNAVNPRSAKADCYGKLTRCGYSSISILAIEAGDPDNCGSEECCEVPAEGDVEIRVTEDDKLAKVPSNGNAQHNGHVREAEEAAKNDVSECDAKKDPVDEAEVNEAGNAMFEKAFDQLLFRIDDCREIMQMYDADSDTADHAYKALQAAYTKCLELADDPADLDELNKTMANEGFVINDAGIIISDGEDSFPVTESGNPYSAGMKMTDVRNASASKSKVNEDDEDSSDDDDASDDSDDSSVDNSSDDSTSSEDSDEDSEKEESDDTSTDDAEKDSSDDSDAADDSSDDSKDEDSSSDDKSEDSTSDEDDSTDDKSDDESSDESDEDEDESDEDENEDESAKKDSEEDDDADNSDEASDEETSDDSDDDSEADDSEKKEDLTDEEKAEMKGEYKKVFRNVMSKCKFEDKCFDDLSIKEKVKFFQKLNADWKKNDPQDFMSDKEIEQLNKVVIKKA